MNNEMYFENGMKHKFSAEEIETLQYYIYKAYVEDILGLDFLEKNADKIVDTEQLTVSAEYQQFSSRAKALVGLYSLFCEHLD